MFDFTEVIKDINPTTSQVYQIKSNLYNASLPSTKSDTCKEWLLKTISTAKDVKILNLDELKAWYCDKYIGIDPNKGVSISIKSCDAFYFSPDLTKNKHLIVEFKNVSRDKFYNKQFCEEIAEKIFTSRSILLHTFFETFNVDYFSNNVEMLIVYNYDESALKTQASAKNIAAGFRKAKNKQTGTEKKDYLGEAEKNIETMICNYEDEFFSINIVKAEEFKNKYLYKLTNHKCIKC
ncbi:hypothetical protein [Acetoanaerobium noterae]|uniref:hypothetical protein n=1 Tax=Acetoanaerobium noterae TaxID=745369 RepID=UPI00333F13EF